PAVRPPAPARPPVPVRPPLPPVAPKPIQRPLAAPAPALRPAAAPSPAAEPTPASRLSDRVVARPAPEAEPRPAPANANLSYLPEAERLKRIKAAVLDRIIGELGEGGNERHEEGTRPRADQLADG